jgi:hypothetical protein
METSIKTAIIEHIKYTDLYYVDYRDELSTENLDTILTTGTIESENYMDFDYECDSLDQIVQGIQDTFEFEKFWIEDDNIEDFLEENRDEIRDIIYDTCSNDPLPDLIKNAGSQPIRLTAYSNYEWIRSDWNESQGGWYSYSEGFKDIIDILNLDPQTLKKTMIDKGFKVQGAFPSKKNRLGMEYISYSDFTTEINNTTSECNLLTFVGLADIRDFLTHDKAKTKITIPKGNSCGLFDSACGGWSMIECELLRDFTIDITELHGEKSSCDSWSLSIDSEWNGYSIDSVYGVTREFWGKEISVA